MTDLKNKRVLFVSQFSAPYPGNFINSLIYLENRLVEDYHCSVFFAFPESIKLQQWFDEFSKNHQTFLIPNPATSINALEALIKETDADIIHTHFDGYDVPVVKACKNIDKDIHVIWHLHDNLYFLKNPLKSLILLRGYICHYGITLFNSSSKNKISAIYVNEHEKRFIRPYRLWKKFHKEQINPNGINVEKFNVMPQYSISRNPFVFLAYGGRNFQKRIDVLLKAGSILKNRGVIGYRIVITKGTDTEEVVKTIFPNGKPDWLELLPQTKNVKEYLEKAHCFVSCSKAETFSYAVCEASIFGLPVIQSDIEGTKWNSDNPSTFVFKSLDAQDLADKMIKVMSTDETILNDAIAITKQNNIIKYSFEGWTTRVIDFYKNL